MNKNTISALLLALSGCLITLVSAFFSIKGFVLFLPDKELAIGILGLGIAFEIAKISVSTFLFHKMKDKDFPIFFKIIMTFAVVSLIVFSSIFTFVHLNASASKNMVSSNVNTSQIETLVKQNEEFQNRISLLDKEFKEFPDTKPNSKMRLYEKIKPEKNNLENKIIENTTKITNLQNTSIDSDQYIFLESLSKSTNLPKEKIFMVVILFIVITIDPLAISLFLAASFIYSRKESKEKSISNKPTKNINPKHLAEVRTSVLNTLYPIESIKNNEIKDNKVKVISNDSSTEIKVIQKNKTSNEKLSSLENMIFSYLPIKEDCIINNDTPTIIEEEKEPINSLIGSVNNFTEEIKNENKDDNEYEGEDNNITLPIVSDNDNLLQYKFIKIKK
ncbi:MAG: hypothetical protein [Bacteriophage sp.]|nr:MAG: hypothetical protein [Bacteriophage sp.]